MKGQIKFKIGDKTLKRPYTIAKIGYRFTNDTIKSLQNVVGTFPLEENKSRMP